jgi:2-oxoglutarate ferredoxin oxidoreductase subunit delta
MPFIKVNSERCKGCQLCIGVCPRHMLALADVLNQLGIQPVQVVGDPSQCSGCMSCTLMCPDAAIEISADQPAEQGRSKK